MVTAARINGLRVVIYSNDHRPSHVHVMGSGKEAVVNLNCPDGPPMLRENYGLSLRELNQILSELTHQLRAFCRKWRQIHGPY
ncbi:MAG: DUF4160 domain-containing protein [Alphaproteobacteria bacterium]|nr:DUF4160 domain-containing protein [Alphaproteobacteria bacterium]